MKIEIQTNPGNLLTYPSIVKEILEHVTIQITKDIKEGTTTKEYSKEMEFDNPRLHGKALKATISINWYSK